MMMNHSRRLRNCFPILVLAVSCNLLLASGLQQQRSVDYRRNRVRVSPESETNLRQAATATATGARNLSNRRRRTRGSVGGKPQNQRELGKSGGKSGGSSSGGGSSGGSSSGGGSSGGSSSGGSSSGGSAHSEASYAENGSYIGCLGTDNAYANYGFDTHGVNCDFTVTQNSYGYGQRDPNPDNSQSYITSYFKYNRLVEWQVVEEPESDYFTEYGYHNDEWESVYGDNYDVYGDNYEGNNNYGDAYQEEVVVVEEADAGYDPYLAFDIGKCDTYSRLWTYDLFDSCAYGKENCECTYALKLMEMDLLTCSDAKDCPSECGVCSQCLHSICDQYLPSQLIANEVKMPAGFAMAAVFSTVVLAAWVTHQKNKPKRGNKLMDEEGTSYTAKNWSIPVGKDGLPTEGKTKKSKPVWLAPDVSTIKRKPLFPDVLKKDNDGGDDASSVEMRVAPRPIKKAKQEAPPKKKRSSKRNQSPVIVTSSDVSIPSSLSWNGGDSDSDSDHGEI